MKITYVNTEDPVLKAVADRAYIRLGEVCQELLNDMLPIVGEPQVVMAILAECLGASIVNTYINIAHVYGVEAYDKHPLRLAMSKLLSDEMKALAEKIEAYRDHEE